MPSILEIGAYASLCALAYVSALVPIVNAELLVVGSSVVAGKGWTQAMTVAAIVAVGQMGGKVTLYLMGRGASKIPSERQRKAIDKWGSRFSRSPRMVMLLVFASAASGFPPFYAISVLAGTFGVNLAAFFVVGLAGRVLRFGILALSPAWLGWHAPGVAP